ncbi:MAG: hypothetical protein ABI480_03420 [Chitinophagaceae bacterium]
MLLNLFFDHMNSSLELILIGAFIFAIYWFILRKYNSLGLRLFVLCFLLFVGCSVWLYKDEMKLKNTITTGEEHIATVLSKSITGKNDNTVELSFTAKDGKTINAVTSDYISKPEWDKFESGKPLSVLYVANTNKTYVQQSIMRFKGDKIYLYFFAGFWLLLGTIVYIWLRKYKVGVDESGNEWVEKPDGTVILDERKSRAFRVAKRGNILSKLVQTFGK